ncbi:hypothetical protein [Aeromonas veronii]|uniref:hypothetical protein n=1 Tax=Aeromonas veronii TaxID=654 RepID=UPI003D215CAC
MNLSNLAREARSALQLFSGTTTTHQQTLELLAAALGFGSYAALTHRSIVLVDADVQETPMSTNIERVQERAKDILGQEIPAHIIVDIMRQHRVHVLTLLEEDEVNKDENPPYRPSYRPAYALHQLARLAPLIDHPNGENHEVVDSLVKQVRRIAEREHIPALLVALSDHLSIPLQEPEAYLDFATLERRDEAYRLYLGGAELHGEQLQIAKSEAYARWRKGMRIDLLLDAIALDDEDTEDLLADWIRHDDQGVNLKYISGRNLTLVAPMLMESSYHDDAVQAWLAATKHNGIKHKLVSSCYQHDLLYRATVNTYFSRLFSDNRWRSCEPKIEQKYHDYLLLQCDTEEQASYLFPDWNNRQGRSSLRALSPALDEQAKLDAKRIFDAYHAR